MRRKRRVVGDVGGAARTHRRDDLHDATRVVERHDDVGDHEAEVRHAENVDLVARHALEARSGLVADVAHGATDQQRQPRHASDGARPEFAGDHAQRVVGVLPADATVLDDDLVPASADDLAVAQRPGSCSGPVARRR